MTVNELIAKLESLPDELKDQPVFYFDGGFRERVRFVTPIPDTGPVFVSNESLWNKKPA